MTRLSWPRHRPHTRAGVDLSSWPASTAGPLKEITMLRMLAPVAALALVASPTLAAATVHKVTKTQKVAKSPAKKVVKTTTTKKAS